MHIIRTKAASFPAIMRQFVLVCLMAMSAFALEDGLARTPPMGWYPWNAFGQGQNEALIKEITDSLVGKGMKDAGYQFVGPDEGICFYRDSSGKLQTNPQRYPGGLKGLGDYIHAKGFRYALYSDAGSTTCSGGMPGMKDYESNDALSFASWGCDYLKVDWCSSGGQNILASYTKIRNALWATGRPIVYSLCSWGDGGVTAWGDTVGHLWRTTGDICAPGGADFGAVSDNASGNGDYRKARPGAWNDPDMLMVGMPPLSEGQNRAHFSLWCIMASPLIAGNDIRAMSTAAAAIYTNIEAIAVDQDPLGIQGHKIGVSGNAEIWARKKLYDGGYAAVVFNSGTAAVTATLRWADLGADSIVPLYVRDVWKHTTSGPTTRGMTVNVPPNDAVMLRFSTQNAFPVPPIIVASSYAVFPKSTRSSPQELYDTITLTNKGSDDVPLWKITSGLPGWLSVAAIKRGSSTQSLVVNTHTSGLKSGTYHAIVRADNTEPVSGLKMSTVWFDVELSVPNDVSGVPACIGKPAGDRSGQLKCAVNATERVYDMTGRRIALHDAPTLSNGIFFIQSEHSGTRKAMRPEKWK